MLNSFHKQKAFTLIELAMVLLIMAGLFLLVGDKSGTAIRLREEGFIRNLRETISFLYNQSIADQTEYVLNIAIAEDGTFSYNVGTMGSGNKGDIMSSGSSDLRTAYYQGIAYPKEPEQDVKKKSKYAAKGDYTAKGFYGTRKEREQKEAEEETEDGKAFRPAQNFPSLATPNLAPNNFKIKDILILENEYTPEDADSVQIVFSPKGFVDFSVIHFFDDRKGEYTLLINPFTGFTEFYNEYKEFEWAFGDES